MKIPIVVMVLFLVASIDFAAPQQTRQLGPTFQQNANTSVSQVLERKLRSLSVDYLMDIAGDVNPEIIAFDEDVTMFLTKSYYRPVDYFDGNPHGGNTYRRFKSNKAITDGGSLIDLTGGYFAEGVFPSGTVQLAQFGVLDDSLMDQSVLAQNALDYARDYKGRRAEFLIDKFKGSLRIDTGMYFSGTGRNKIYGSDNSPVIYSTNEITNVRLLDFEAIAEGSAGNSLVPVVSFPKGSSDGNFDFTIKGKPGVSEHGIAIFGANPEDNVANNNCYNNIVSVRTGTVDNSEEIDGSGMYMGGEIINSGCNANKILGKVYDGFKKGITVGGNGNLFANPTFNGPATDGAIEFIGILASGNTLLEPYFDGGITGPDVVTNVSAKKQVVTIFGGIGFDRRSVVHEGAEDGIVVYYGHDTFEINRNFYRMRNQAQDSAVVRLIGNEVVLDGTAAVIDLAGSTKNGAKQVYELEQVLPIATSPIGSRAFIRNTNTSVVNDPRHFTLELTEVWDGVKYIKKWVEK